jgi:signal transduction histidine kinase
VLLLAIVALEVPLALNLRDRVDAEVKTEALGQADLVAATAAGQLGRAQAGRLRELAGRAAKTSRGRVVIVDRAGILLADSAGEDTLGVSYASRPEIAGALKGKPVQETRRSDTLDQRILATAVPVLRQGKPEGAVRVTQSMKAVSRATRSSILGLVAIGGLVLLLGLGAGALIAGQIAGPLRRLDEAAAQVSHGDLSVRARVEGSAEQRSLAQTFNLMTERLERLVESQREFVADASHQLRTPLSGLRLRLEEARAVAREPAAREEIDAGLAEVDRLAAMVGELLLLSQAGEVDAPAEQVDLADAARRAAARWDGRGVSALAGAPVPPVRCAPADLDRALDALVENGLHYGGGAVTLIARPGAIDVLDEGPGVAPDELEQVFERFHRGREGRAGTPGTGLGLPIARELMRRWGGDVRLANREGGGTAATVVLPFDGA